MITKAEIDAQVAALGISPSAYASATVAVKIQLLTAMAYVKQAEATTRLAADDEKVPG